MKVTRAQVIMLSTAGAAAVAAAVGIRHRKALAAGIRRWAGMLSVGADAAQEVIEEAAQIDEEEMNGVITVAPSKKYTAPKSKAKSSEDAKRAEDDWNGHD